MSEQIPNPHPSLPVVLQPDPILERRSGIWGTILASLGMTTVVVTVLYGLNRPETPQQTASAPAEAAAGSIGSQSQPAKPEPSTTGQGQRNEPDQQQSNPGKAERSDSATTGAKPGDQPKPPQQ
jgi:hypothetical protein